MAQFSRHIFFSTGSGKSTVAQTLFRCAPWKYVAVNQDTLKTRKACLDATHRILASSATTIPVIDRCNISRDQRKHFVSLKQTRDAVDCVFLDTPKHVCIRRCQNRTNHPTVAPKNAARVVGFQCSDYQEPALTEGFRSLRIIRTDSDLQKWIVDLLMAEQ